MKTLALVIGLFLMGATALGPETDTIYTFEAENIDGKPVSLEKYRGKVLLIVNTASECGYTPQYEGIQALYEKYKDRGLVVLGFPANDFGGQEPGTNEEIKKFCKVNYDVTFPMFSKLSVKGENIHPLFKYLISRENPDFTGEIKWNFEKFIIDREGNLIRRFRSAVKPKNNEVVSTIESALKS